MQGSSNFRAASAMMLFLGLAEDAKYAVSLQQRHLPEHT
jgi:hypothetical protein